MGAALDIYTLWAWHRAEPGALEHVLVHARRPDFANWSQNAEEAAYAALDHETRAALARLRDRGPRDRLEPLGQWQDGSPVGTAFDDPGFEGAVEIWVAWHRVPGHLVFGAAPDEAAFRAALREAEDAGDNVQLDELVWPARRLRAMLLRAG